MVNKCNSIINVSCEVAKEWKLLIICKFEIANFKLMNLSTLAIYCFLDDLLQKMRVDPLDKRGKLNDAD